MTFLPTSWLDHDLLSKPKFHGRFSATFIGCSVTHLAADSFTANMAAGGDAFLLIETPLYLLHIADEVLVKFKEHLKSAGQEMGMELEGEDEKEDTKKCCLIRMSRPIN